MFKQILAVLNKEILDARRDLKAIMPGLMMPLLFAGMTYGTIQFLVSVRDQPQKFELAVEGAERALPLISTLREAGIEIIAAPADPIEAVNSQQLDMVLVIPEDFEEQFRAQRRANLDLIWDVSRMDSHAQVNYVKQQINHWSMTTGSLRLLLRGVSPEISQVLVVSDINVASDQEMASKILGSLPMVILLFAFVAGAGMSSEMAAGERENRTLEPVLITPIAHSTLFLGKWLAAVLVTLLITLMGVALQLISVNTAPLEQLGLRLVLTLNDFIVMMLILMPVIVLATALQLLVSFLSKSFKDAQSYNQLLMLLPVVPGMYILLSGGSAESWQMWIPLLGAQWLIADIFSGQSIQWLDAGVAALSALVFAAICARMAVGLMKREAQ
jgi:sodium transport system permease protein